MDKSESLDVLNELIRIREEHGPMAACERLRCIVTEANEDGYKDGYDDGARYGFRSEIEEFEYDDYNDWED